MCHPSVAWCLGTNEDLVVDDIFETDQHWLCYLFDGPSTACMLNGQGSQCQLQTFLWRAAIVDLELDLFADWSQMTKWILPESFIAGCTGPYVP